jgi:hypothetical protein
MEFELPVGLVERALNVAEREPVRRDPGRVIRFTGRTALVRVAALVIGVLLANVGAAYFAPKYGQALADSPIVGGVAGPVLRFSGLDANQITRLDASATSSGHTIKLVGGFADTEMTVLLMEFDGEPHGLPNKQRECCYADGALTDQFGREYKRVYSPDALTATFEPLAGPARDLGARLTLHVTELKPLGRNFQAVSGEWTLRLTLLQHAGVVLPVPGPSTANGITYTLKSVRLSGTQLRIQFELSGPLVEQQRDLPAQPMDNRSFASGYVRPTLVDAQGNLASVHQWGFTTPKRGPVSGGMTAVVPGGGRYTLTFGTAFGGPTFQIDVP